MVFAWVRLTSMVGLTDTQSLSSCDTEQSWVYGNGSRERWVGAGLKFGSGCGCVGENSGWRWRSDVGIVVQ